MISSLSGAASGYSSRSIASLLATLTERVDKAGETSSRKDAAEASSMLQGPPPGPPPPSAATGIEAGTVPAESLFSALVANDDADGDGMISATELAASPVGADLSAQFDALDTDGNGLISETEMTAAEAATTRDVPPPPPPSGGADAGDGSSAEGGASTVSSLAELLIQALSAAGDTASKGAASDLVSQFMDALNALA